MAPDRRRVLVAVSPQILGDALVRVLEAAGVDDVVFAPPGRPAVGAFDGAVVSDGCVVDVAVDVIIHLSDGSGPSVVHTVDGDAVIDLRDLMGLARILDEHVGGSSSRAAWLASRDQ